MDIFLDPLEKSIQHLKVIDEIFATEDHPNKEIYLNIRKKLTELNVSDGPRLFTDELYVGGKKGQGKDSYGRQMILGDIIEYIFFGRGYYYAQFDKKRKSIFIEILLNVINLLMILDSLTVNTQLCNKILKQLEQTIGNDFYANDEMKQRHKALELYQGDIGFDVSDPSLPSNVLKVMDYDGDDPKETRRIRNKLDDYYDSLLPKTGGGLWNELIVYLYLLRINAGYILPLLLHQRLLSRDLDPSNLKPPDYLVITRDSNLFGVEVGGQKEKQSGDFALKTGTKVLTTTNTNIPPRCPICGEWILFCPQVIKDYTDIEDNPLLYVKKDVRCCHDCEFYKPDQVLRGECPFTQYHGEVSNSINPKQSIKFATEYHYHYKCILQSKDTKALEKIQKQKERVKKYKEKNKTENIPPHMQINVLKTNYPYVSGLELLEHVHKEDLVCFGKHPNGKNCGLCKFVEDCTNLTEISNAMQSIGYDRETTLSKLKTILYDEQNQGSGSINADISHQSEATSNSES